MRHAGRTSFVVISSIATFCATGKGAQISHRHARAEQSSVVAA